MIKIKRLYEPASPEDGCRVLVDRLWPRGVRKQDLQYDIWAKEIAPSDALRKWYHQEPESHWAEFRTRYLQELENSAAVRDFIEKIRREEVVTLLYASRNAEENHALVLQEYLLNTQN